MSSTPSSLLQTTTTTTAPSASSATGAMDAREESTRGSTYDDDSASREKEATSTDSALGGESTRSVGYKGKALRSWMQLPPEVIRCVQLLSSFFGIFVLFSVFSLPASWCRLAHGMVVLYDFWRCFTPYAHLVALFGSAYRVWRRSLCLSFSSVFPLA
jgi:hypothetical protein